MKPSLENKTIIGFGCALALLAAMGVVAFHNTMQSAQDAACVKHTQEVLNRLTGLLSTMTDVETGQRGYTITGNELFLEPCHAATARVDAELQKLRELAADNPRQLHRLDAIAPLAAAMVAFSHEVVELRRAQGFESARQATATLKGKQLHDNIRGIVSEMQEEENRILLQREEEARSAIRFTLAAVVFGGVLAPVVAGLAVLAIFRDIASRRRTEEALQKAHAELERRVAKRTAELSRYNRALKVITECNQALVRATTETELLQRICCLLVDHGGYRMAWVGFAEQDEAKSVRPVAQFGFEDGYLDTVNITWADAERGRGPTGTGIRTARPVIARNIPTDPDFAPWRAAAIQRGYASSATLPLIDGGRAFGALMIYSASPDAFDAEEMAVLGELAGDLAYGITALRTRVERERAEEALRQSQALVQMVADGTPDAIYVKDAQGRYLMANAGMLQFLGKSLAEVLGRDDTAFFPPEDASRIMAGDRRVMDSGAAQTYEEVVSIHGQPRTFLSTKGPWRDAQGRVVGLFGIAHDITERKRDEAAVQRERGFSDAILNSLPGVVYCYDQNFRFLRWNKTFERVLGHTSAEIARMSPLDFFAGPDKERVAARIQEVFEKGESDVEAEFLAKDGTRTPYYFTGLRTEIDGGTHLVGVGVDISARKRAEGERQKFAMIADSSSEFIGMCDLNLNPLYVNPAGVRMVGLPDVDTACKVPVQDYFFPEDQRFITEEFFPRVLRDGHGEVEIRLRHFQTGEPIWMFYYLFSVRDASGTPIGWATVSRDITERKRAETALRASEQEFRSLAEAMPQMAWVTRPDGWNIYFNQQWTDYTGMTLEESYGHGWNKPFHPDDRKRAWDAWQNATQNNATYSLECRLRRADGEYRWWLVRGVPLRDADGKILKWFGTCTDIEDIKKAEAEILQLNEALREHSQHLERNVAERTAELAEARDLAESANRAQERLSGQYVARDSHADDRHPRLHATAPPRSEHQLAPKPAA